jgi:hypothetical protein
MRDLQLLMLAEVQMVYLTVTLSPADEEEFIKLAGLPSKAAVVWFRDPTIRRGLKYQVV